MKPSDLNKINQVLDESNDNLNELNFLSEEISDDLSGNDWDELSDDEWEEEGEHMDDMGAESELDAALSDDGEPGDIVDEQLEMLVDMLVANDYTDESAEVAVFDAVASLVDDGSLDDSPEEDSSDEEKTIWIMNAVPKIKARLWELGLEFDDSVK